MAPIKFEENIKDKLEKRTLSPSSEGWSKLSERLDADQKKSRNPLFWWLSIAAGIIIMIAVSTQFFNSGISGSETPQIVEENVIDEEFQDKELNKKESIQLANEERLETNNEDELIVNEPQIIDYKNVAPTKVKVKADLVEQDITKSEIKTSKQEELLNKEAQDLLDETIMKNAVTEALKELKSENTGVTDKEIDSLLKLASKELFKDKLQKETIKTVDANALLMSVEDEMGQSFRSKVYEALKESYETVKTAVADRNN